MDSAARRIFNRARQRDNPSFCTRIHHSANCKYDMPIRRNNTLLSQSITQKVECRQYGGGCKVLYEQRIFVKLPKRWYNNHFSISNIPKNGVTNIRFYVIFLWRINNETNRQNENKIFCLATFLLTLSACDNQERVEPQQQNESQVTLTDSAIT